MRRRNYPSDRDPVVDPADLGRAPEIDIAGISYRLPSDRMMDFLYVILGLDSVPKELQNLLPGQTVEMPINGDIINIRRTIYKTSNRVQFFPDHPNRRKYTPREIRTMKNIDLRARAYFDRCGLLPSAIYERILRPI